MGLLLGAKFHFFHTFETGIKDIAESYSHSAVEISIVSQQDPVFTDISAYSVRVAVFFVCIPRKNDKSCTKSSFYTKDEIR